jgi:hypothetical protein
MRIGRKKKKTGQIRTNGRREREGGERQRKGSRRVEEKAATESGKRIGNGSGVQYFFFFFFFAFFLLFLIIFVTSAFFVSIFWRQDCFSI